MIDDDCARCVLAWMDLDTVSRTGESSKRWHDLAEEEMERRMRDMDDMLCNMRVRARGRLLRRRFLRRYYMRDERDDPHYECSKCGRATHELGGCVWCRPRPSPPVLLALALPVAVLLALMWAATLFAAIVLLSQWVGGCGGAGVSLPSWLVALCVVTFHATVAVVVRAMERAWYSGGSGVILF